MIPIERWAALGAMMTMVVTAPSALGCACGCGVFDVGNVSVVPQQSDSGLTAFVRFAWMDQNRNQEGSSRASAADNKDKDIRSGFYTVGSEYMINHKWSVMAQVPLVARSFTTTGSDLSGNAVIETVPLTDLGDAMVRVTYTGFASDMSTGIHFGVKLPTGRYTSPLDRFGSAAYDRDTLPGSGSTDVLVGGYHVSALGHGLNGFTQLQYQFAVAKRNGYRPGNDLNGALGLSWDLGAKVPVTPVLQAIGSVRARDTGPDSSLNSGYQRLLIAPGLRLRLTRKLSVYADVELPVVQHVKTAGSIAVEGTLGQLVAPVLLKAQINYGF